MKDYRSEWISLSWMILALLFFSCEKKELSEFTDTPIIDGYLKPNDYLKVRISRQIPFSSDVSYSGDNVDQLDVVIKDDLGTYHLQPIGDGTYVDSSQTAKAGKSYTLTFTYNSKEVVAYTYIPSAPANVNQSVSELYLEQRDSTNPGMPGGSSMPDPVKISWNNPDNSYYLLLVENTEEDPEAVNNFGGNAPTRVFRKSPTNFSSEEIRAMEFQYFGKTRIILYHVLPDYASLYNQSGTSSQNLTNPSTSIVNGYGIFTGLNPDTLWINVKKQ